jgi:hypothetical protein
LRESNVLAYVRITYGFVSHLKRSVSNNAGTQNNSGPHRSYHLGNKGKAGIAVALIAVILVSAFIFFPRDAPAVGTPGNTTDPVATTNGTNSPSTGPSNSNGPTKVPFTPLQPLLDTLTGKDRSAEVVTNSATLNSSVWRQVATYSWSYFQPGVGVDSRTGLPASGDTVSYFTDWDLGVYLQAVMDAQKIGLIGNDGTWGSSARIDKVMTFLENRQLNSDHYPYWFYYNDGTVNHQLSDRATELCYTADTGRLFVALNNIKAYNSSFSGRIDNLVYNTYGNRSNYASLVPNLKTESQTSTSIYAYYIISGFASFWPNQLKDAPARILNNIMTSPPVKTPENITLPNSRLTEDPLLCAIFELPNTTQLTTLSKQAYMAHEAFYNATSIYRAFGEGNTFTDAWAYEWIVYDGKTWEVKDASGAELDINPIVYTKVAFSFLALYNTTYARNMVMFIEDRMENPSNGYSNGVSEVGTVLGATGLHTNGLILSAARYAIVNYP